jgi:hypothetical protein
VWCGTGQQGVVRFEEAPSSVQELSMSLAFDVFPNPVTENITIRARGREIDHIRIHELNGATVWEEKGISKQEFRLNTLALHPGIYFVEIISGDERITKKLIRLN